MDDTHQATMVAESDKEEEAIGRNLDKMETLTKEPLQEEEDAKRKQRRGE